MCCFIHSVGFFCGELLRLLCLDFFIDIIAIYMINVNAFHTRIVLVHIYT